MECANFLLIESGASADFSCESGIRPRDIISIDEIKDIFVKFYDNIDESLKDKNSDLDMEHMQFDEIYKRVTEMQYQS